METFEATKARLQQVRVAYLSIWIVYIDSILKPYTVICCNLGPAKSDNNCHGYTAGTGKSYLHQTTRSSTITDTTNSFDSYKTIILIVPNHCTTKTKLLARPKHALHAPIVIIFV